MKTLILPAVFLFSTTSAISPEYEIDKYPALVKNGCPELTATKTRISSKYNLEKDLACSVHSWEKYQQEKLPQSQINANNAQAEPGRELGRKRSSMDKAIRPDRVEVFRYVTANTYNQQSIPTMNGNWESV